MTIPWEAEARLIRAVDATEWERLEDCVRRFAGMSERERALVYHLECDRVVPFIGGAHRDTLDHGMILGLAGRLLPDQHHDFSFLISHNREVPTWAWEKAGMYHGRITRAAIEELYGPLRDGQPLSDAFEHISASAKTAAGAKVHAASGNVTEPVMVDVSDLT